MNRYQLTGQRLAALMVVAALLLNYPLLSLFSVEGAIFGIPVLYAYLFSVWAVVIALMAFFVAWR